MQGIQYVVKSAKKAVLNTGLWEVILTDPSLNKFNFGAAMSGNYIMTDIISPFGKKSILYSTINDSYDREIMINLNFEDIDEANISCISFKGTKAFFDTWIVVLRDNRNGKERQISDSTDIDIEPAITYNRLMKMGFVSSIQKEGDHFFELRIKRNRH
ncbi:MAG: hypothetical protein MI700_12545 [Balneolales bacterium]|nr:hypothetical protein [Balneolales bacterium]